MGLFFPVYHFEFSTSRGNISARSCSYEKHLRQRFLIKWCLKTQVCLLSNEWALKLMRIACMDLDDLMINVWSYIEISDVCRLWYYSKSEYRLRKYFWSIFSIWETGDSVCSPFNLIAVSWAMIEQSMSTQWALKLMRIAWT